MVVITPSAADIPTAGVNYSLECSLTVTTNRSRVMYQWLDSNGTSLVTAHQLRFSPLRVSDAGLYICQATVEGTDMRYNGTATVNVNRKKFHEMCIR